MNCQIQCPVKPVIWSLNGGLAKERNSNRVMSLNPHCGFSNNHGRLHCPGLNHIVSCLPIVSYASEPCFSS